VKEKKNRYWLVILLELAVMQQVRWQGDGVKDSSRRCRAFGIRVLWMASKGAVSGGEYRSDELW